MPLALDFPQCSHSFLGRLEPRWKMAALVLAGLFFTRLTTLPAVLGAWAFSLLSLTHRFVFSIAEEFAHLRIALRVRVFFRSRNNWHNYRTIGQVIGTLSMRSRDRAERVG